MKEKNLLAVMNENNLFMTMAYLGSLVTCVFKFITINI